MQISYQISTIWDNECEKYGLITLCPHFHTTMANPLNFVQIGQEKWKEYVEFIHVLKEGMPIAETFS